MQRIVERAASTVRPPDRLFPALVLAPSRPITTSACLRVLRQNQSSTPVGGNVANAHERAFRARLGLPPSIPLRDLRSLRGENLKANKPRRAEGQTTRASARNSAGCQKADVTAQYNCIPDARLNLLSASSASPRETDSPLHRRPVTPEQRACSRHTGSARTNRALSQPNRPPRCQPRRP